jgi:hypothetical protein
VTGVCLVSLVGVLHGESRDDAGSACAECYTFGACDGTWGKRRGGGERGESRRREHTACNRVPNVMMSAAFDAAPNDDRAARQREAEGKPSAHTSTGLRCTSRSTPLVRPPL